MVRFNLSRPRRGQKWLSKAVWLVPSRDLFREQATTRKQRHSEIKAFGKLNICTSWRAWNSFRIQEVVTDKVEEWSGHLWSLVVEI